VSEFHLSRKHPEPENANFIAPSYCKTVDNKDDGLQEAFEPTLLFEYCPTSFHLQKRRGTTACFNGYMTLEALYVERGMIIK
jgi:hypothetical protein